MNILLFFPGLLVLLFQYTGLMETFKAVVIILFVQLGLPSLYFWEHNNQAWSYFRSAFDFSRQFLFKWTVNWHLLGEKRFLSPTFARTLVALHVLTLVAFGWFRWNPVPGGTPAVLKRGLASLRALFKPAVLPGQLKSHRELHCCPRADRRRTPGPLQQQLDRSCFCALTALPVSRLVLSPTAFPPLLRRRMGPDSRFVSSLRMRKTDSSVGLLAVLEKAWDTYPATSRSSLMLNIAHAVMLGGLWWAGRPGRRDAEPRIDQRRVQLL